MRTTRTHPIRRHVYRRINDDKTCTGYLVERYNGKVVARIVGLGEIPEQADDVENELQNHFAMSLSGEWLETNRPNISKIRCVLGANFERED